METALKLWMTAGALRQAVAARYRDELGEGVISTAIAVLIMALIGAAMWVAFSGVFESASERTTDSVNRIGS